MRVRESGSQGVRKSESQRASRVIIEKPLVGPIITESVRVDRIGVCDIGDTAPTQ